MIPDCKYWRSQGGSIGCEIFGSLCFEGCDIEKRDPTGFLRERTDKQLRQKIGEWKQQEERNEQAQVFWEVFKEMHRITNSLCSRKERIVVDLLVGESYINVVTGEVEEVVERCRFENLRLCSRCCGIVAPPDEPGGVYACCRCGLRFVVGIR